LRLRQQQGCFFHYVGNYTGVPFRDAVPSPFAL